MDAGTLLDVTIGLMFMYLLVSLLCTALNETVAQILKWRSTNLRQSVEAMIDHKSTAMAILDGPFFKRVDTNGSMLAWVGGFGRQEDPAYLSARSFSAALLHTLAGGVVDDKAKAFEAVKAGVARLDGTEVGNSLSALLTQAAGDYETLKQWVANWFDDSMDRLSGAYKRQVQGLTLVLALVVTLGINADTLTVAQALWHDAGLRAQIAAAATKFTEQKSDVANLTRDEVEKIQQELRPLPLGWENEKLPNTQEGRFFYLMRKMAGYLPTILAIMLGAPFWFDTLSQFVRLRGTGAKPQRDDVARS